jgi:hypothetical protein
MHPRGECLHQQKKHKAICFNYIVALSAILCIMPMITVTRTNGGY